MAPIGFIFAAALFFPELAANDFFTFNLNQLFMKKRQEILDTLPYFRGSAEYYRHPFLNHQLLLSEGAIYIREACECYWFFDMVAQQAQRHEEFAVTLKQLMSKEWLITFQDLNLKKVLYSQQIPYSDFPLSEIKLWYMNGICYLPSEH